MKTLYEAHASATGGRNGRVTTDDGTLDLQLTMPKALGGAGGPAANPDQLFTCGYAARFDSALIHVARQQKIKLEGTRVDAAVGIGPNDQGGFALAVRGGDRPRPAARRGAGIDRTGTCHLPVLECRARQCRGRAGIALNTSWRMPP